MSTVLDYPEVEPQIEPKPEPPHVHDYREVPKSERTDRMKFVCKMFKCECGAWYWL